MPARTFRYLGVVGFMNRPETMSAELLSLVLGGYQLMNAFKVARIRIRLFGCSRMPGDGPHKAIQPAAGHFEQRDRAELIRLFLRFVLVGHHEDPTRGSGDN